MQIGGGGVLLCFLLGEGVACVEGDCSAGEDVGFACGEGDCPAGEDGKCLVGKDDVGDAKVYGNWGEDGVDEKVEVIGGQCNLQLCEHDISMYNDNCYSSYYK